MPTLHFKGKSFLRNYHHAAKYHDLVVDEKKSLSKNPSLDDNLIIHGDNLKALKALLPTHAGKVKCIYIDPPYNTGNGSSWVYNDNVGSPMIQEWLGKTVDKDDLTRHDKWCCMMYPRLTLLKELLKDDGVIFISIDDNEAAHLRMLMDEIFGEENFVAQFVWKTRQATGKQIAGNNISTEHEYIIAYGKSAALPFEGVNRDASQYLNLDNDPRGNWAKHPLDVGSTKEERPNCFYDLVDPKTGNIYKASPKRVWAFSKESMAKLIKDNKIIFSPEGNRRPYLKKFWDDLKSEKKPISTWIMKGMFDEDRTNIKAGFNAEGTKLLNVIFKEKIFDYPKPVSLIKELIKQVSKKGDIILDSFSGSGTTAHAVLDLNKEDDGKRKFILVECEDYADKITAERVRRVIKGVPSASDDKLKKGLGGSFTFCELSDQPLEIDRLLEGKNLPNYLNLARYAFYTATGENLDEKKVKEKDFYLGSAKNYEVFMLYAPDKKKLKEFALNLDFAEKIHADFPNREKLVFAPAVWLEEIDLKERGIRFAQLPFEIYRHA